MGPNWELISDAVNSTLQLKVNKSIFLCSSVFFIYSHVSEWVHLFMCSVSILFMFLFLPCTKYAYLNVFLNACSVYSISQKTARNAIKS